jgi:hypothetical protein
MSKSIVNTQTSTGSDKLIPTILTNKSHGVIAAIRSTFAKIFSLSVCIFALCSASTLAQNPSTTKKTNTSDFTTTLLVDKTPKEAFDAINNPRVWWSVEIEGSTNKLNDEFIYHFEDVHYSKLKVVELIPNKKVVWLVKYNHFNFTKDKSEWTGTKIIFEISKKDNKTQIRFTHMGLVPQYECYNICSNAWTKYIQKSLFSLITTGKGQPNQFNKRVKTQ